MQKAFLANSKFKNQKSKVKIQNSKIKIQKWSVGLCSSGRGEHTVYFPFLKKALTIEAPIHIRNFTFYFLIFTFDF